MGIEIWSNTGRIIRFAVDDVNAFSRVRGIGPSVGMRHVFALLGVLGPYDNNPNASYQTKVWHTTAAEAGNNTK